MHLRPQAIRQDDEESIEAASWGTFMLFEAREKRILSHFISLSLSLSLSPPRTRSPSLALSLLRRPRVESLDISEDWAKR